MFSQANLRKRLDFQDVQKGPPALAKLGPTRPEILFVPFVKGGMGGISRAEGTLANFSNTLLDQGNAESGA